MIFYSDNAKKEKNCSDDKFLHESKVIKKYFRCLD